VLSRAVGEAVDDLGHGRDECRSRRGARDHPDFLGLDELWPEDK
jgi:hypothetical protein